MAKFRRNWSFVGFRHAAQALKDAGGRTSGIEETSGLDETWGPLLLSCQIHWSALDLQPARALNRPELTIHV